MRFFSTANLPTDLAKRSFAANLARIFPDGEAPLFALSGMAEKKTALQIEHGYFSKTAQFGKVTLAAAVTSATATTLTVENTSSVSKQDIISVKSDFSGTNFVAPEHMLVTGITSNTTITVIRGFAGTTAKASIPNNTVMPVIGNAYPEGSPKPVAKSIISERHLNNTQIFRNAWSTSKTLTATHLRAGFPAVQENRQDASFFHSRDIELATFFGRKSSGTDPETNEPFHTMDGIEALIQADSPGNIREAGATTSYDQLIDIVDPVFDYRMDSMSSMDRVLYCGKTALKVLNKIGRLSGEYNIMQTESTYGLKFYEIQLPRGKVRIMEHPIFNTNPDWQKLAVIGELSSFDYAYLEGRDTEVTFINEDNKATDGADSKGGVLTTELTIELQNPFAWMFIYGLTDGAA